jgi:hypothetical protein
MYLQKLWKASEHFFVSCAIFSLRQSGTVVNETNQLIPPDVDGAP